MIEDENILTENMLEKPSDDYDKNDADSTIDAIETDSELDMAINEELIKKSQEEIRSRMISLKRLLSDMKTTIKNEKQLWRKEIDQVIATQNYVVHNLRCASKCECCEPSEYELTNKQRRLCNNDEDIEYLYYQRKLNITNYQRNLALENYKKKLFELENMCNAELNRVKNSVQSLQSLQQVVAEWDQASGDSAKINKSIQSYNDDTLKNCGDFTPKESPRTIES